VSVDEELRAARRAVAAAPDDEVARLRLERIEDRLGLRSHLRGEATTFWNQIRHVWRPGGRSLEFADGRMLLSQFVLSISSASAREAPYWSWIRGTQAGWADRPLPFAVRIGDRVAVAVGTARTGPRNLVTPDMVWPEFYPWSPGAHEHTQPNGDTPVELVFSWFESQVANGVCRHCGEATTARLAAAQRELHDRIRAWFNNQGIGKAVASTAAVRFFFDSLRIPSRSVVDDDRDD